MLGKYRHNIFCFILIPNASNFVAGVLRFYMKIELLLSLTRQLILQISDVTEFSLISCSQLLHCKNAVVVNVKIGLVCIAMNMIVFIIFQSTD